MAELDEKFFTGELSDAEWDRLGEELEKSQEMSQRMAERAETAYQKTGLPDPQWPPSGGGLGSGWGGGKMLTLAVAVAGLASAAWIWSPGPAANSVAVSKVEAEAPRPVRAKPSPAPKPAARKNPVYQPKRVVTGQMRPEKEALSVDVKLAGPSLVTARILNPEGGLVHHLYSGMLEEGLWSFEWDGRLSGSEMVTAGNYVIDVKVGGKSYTKTLFIK